ncbi:hypothetical protein AWB76_04895 [Caballeronia temeraria]|uniref:DUF2382 domain-containing protein n=1 Tax=Caballeronia temeraria TaxID=1777137 RepID=A0A158BZ41_9BURK|nr:YsnF/AvaK domain-containing protein [Caballeronia temeraria]SAK75362.1 hypothetical protein AWB76_04895 [Caballeronia temeraria]
MRDQEPFNAASTTDPSDAVRVSAVKEEIAVDVKTVETGAVRVRKVVHEEMHAIPLRVRDQQVEVKRIPVNRPVDERKEPRRAGDTLIIPIYEYVPVVRMQLTLKEEVHVKTTEVQEDVIHQVLTNSKELVVERREGRDGPWKRDRTDKP